MRKKGVLSDQDMVKHMSNKFEDDAKIRISEIKEVKVFRKLVPGILIHFDSKKILKEISYMDIETFLYINSLNVDIELFTRKVNELSEKYDVIVTPVSYNTKVYPIFLLKYVYIHMKDFEKENKELGGKENE